MSRNQRYIAVGVSAMAVLTLLVWGIAPFTRGLRMGGDDLNFAYAAWVNQSKPWWEQFTSRYPSDGPTRALAFWPFVLAVQLPRPGAFLQCFYAGAWLLNGVAVMQLARALRPRDLGFAVMAGCLTTTATADSLTSVVVYGPHLLGIALFVFGITGLVKCVNAGGTRRTLFASFVLLSVSFFTVEYTYPAIPIIPALFWLQSEPGKRVRAMGCSVCVLGAAFLTPFVLLVNELLRPKSYAGSVLAPSGMGSVEWLRLCAEHVAHNFLPLQWADRAIPPWYDNYERVLPLTIYGLAAAASLLVAGWLFWTIGRREVTEPRAGLGDNLKLGLVLAAALALTNLASAQPGGEYYMRSHFVSRIWASLLLALLLSGLNRRTGLRPFSWATLGCWLAAGVWGGLERQDYLLGYALHERQEVRSLRAVVPAVAAEAQLLVIQPPGGPSLLAMNNPRLWPMLYAEPGRPHPVVIAANSAEDYSMVAGDPDRGIRILTNSSTSAWIDPARCVAVFYSISQASFVRLEEMPAGLLPGSSIASMQSYVPERWLVPPSTPPAVVSELCAPNPPWTPPMFKAPRTAMLSLDSSMASFLRADPLTPYTTERSGESSLVWLGAGRASGFSFLVNPTRPMAVALQLQLSSGPDRPDGTVHLQVRVKRPDRTDSTQLIEFAWGFRGTVPLELGVGNSVVEIWVTDQPVGPKLHTDPRALMARLSPIRLTAR